MNAGGMGTPEAYSGDHFIMNTLLGVPLKWTPQDKLNEKNQKKKKKGV